jgi:hypothetical protein
LSSSPPLSQAWQFVGRRPLVVVLVLAAGLRLGVVWWKFENLSADTDSYLAIAKNLLAGEGFCSVPGRPTAFRPPLYPLSVAVCTFCGGTVGLAAMQILLGTATCGLAWAFASRLQLSEKARCLAAVAVAVDPLLLLYTSHAMTETLVTFLVSLLLVLLAGKRSVRSSALAGVVFGLAALCRPSLWAFGVLVAGGSLIQLLRGKSEQAVRTEWLRLGIPTVLAVLVTIAPWAIRNSLVFGRPIVMTTHGGYTLLLANNPVFFREVVDGGRVWSGESLGNWQAEIDRSLMEKGISEFDELGRDGAMKDQALQFIRRHPIWFGRSCVTRVCRFWGLVPRSGAVTIPVRLAVGSFYLLVFTLFVAGLVRIRKLSKNVLPSVLLTLSLTCVHSVFWSNARMRAPLAIVVASFAASVVFPVKTAVECTSGTARARKP